MIMVSNILQVLRIYHLLENNNNVAKTRNRICGFFVRSQVFISPDDLRGSSRVLRGVICGGDYAAHRTARLGCKGHW